MRYLNFTVDSELLRELGERLIGRQYIALAELVKNSFDADATHVTIRISEHQIQVSDNGHGMTEDDFRDRWMRVGSTHKVRQRTSPAFNRPLTGSKGIGRLAVQFLASELEIVSVPRIEPDGSGIVPMELFALVDWENAVQAGDLTQATALYDVKPPQGHIFPLEAQYGTTVTLRNLKHEWSPQEFEQLAREIWFLQPPFRSLSPDTEQSGNDFRVELISLDPDTDALFDIQMSRILDLYSARLVGHLQPLSSSSMSMTPRRVALSLEIDGQIDSTRHFYVPIRGPERCLIDSLEFEIRIYTLRYRQPYGIRVKDARQYMSEWGGVHIYDAGFRIPYAGASADWLNLEIDHSHRLTQSRLLPSELNVPMGLNYLPTNSRVLGVVKIDTAKEARAAAEYDIAPGQHLQIQVSRDRMVANGAFIQLQAAVRWALDYYATRLALRRLEEKRATQDQESSQSLIRNVVDVLDKHADVIPVKVANELRKELDKTIDAVREQSDWTRARSGLLGAMATIGATAIAFDHQFNQQLALLRHHLNMIETVIETNVDLSPVLDPIVTNLATWIREARDTRRMFSPVTDERNRSAIARFRARDLVSTMVDNLRPVLRGIEVNVRAVDPDLRLPKANYPLWMAVFHNIFLNASNALTDCPRKSIDVSSFESNSRHGLKIQDTGVGVDLRQAEKLFLPLTRGVEISDDRRALGYGGSGLGLAIVKMLATDAKAHVRFARPSADFTTCFEISWKEQAK